jgi:hypothetical protein
MKKILFVAGGVLIGWGAYCWYKQDQNKKQPVTGTTTDATSASGVGDTKQPDQPMPALPSNELAVQARPEVEMTITEEPLLYPPESQAVRYFNTNPSALYHRPRTTIAVDAALANDVITIDSINTYSR